MPSFGASVGGNQITLGELAAEMSLDTSQVDAAILQVKGNIAELLVELQRLGLLSAATSAKMSGAWIAAMNSIRQSQIPFTAITNQQINDVERATRRYMSDWNSAIRENTARIKEAENLILNEVKTNEAKRIESEKLVRRIESELRKADLAEEVEANRVKREAAKVTAASNTELASGAALGGRLAGGWTGAAVARGAFSLSAPIISGVALAAATYELVKWTKQAEEAAQKTSNFAEELGITWSQARNLEELAKLAGTEIGTLAQASGRLAESLDSGTTAGKRISKALQDIGVSGSSSGELLINFLHALSEIPDQTTRIAKAREVLGRGAAEIVPLISNLKELNDVLARMGDNGSESADSLNKAALKLNELEVAWTRLKQDLAIAAYPTITFLVSAVAKELEGSGGTPIWRHPSNPNTPLVPGKRSSIDGFSSVEEAEKFMGEHPKNFNEEQFQELTRQQDLRAKGWEQEQAAGRSRQNQHAADLLAVNEYLKKREETLDGLKKELQEEKEISAENDKQLSSKVDILTGQPRVDAGIAKDAADKRILTLQQQIKLMEAKSSGGYERAANSSYEFRARQVDAKRRQQDYLDLINQPITTKQDDTSSFAGIDAAKTRDILAVLRKLQNQSDDIAQHKTDLASTGADKTTSVDLDNEAQQNAIDAGTKIREIVRNSLEATQRLREQFSKADLEDYAHTLNEEKRLQEEFSKDIAKMATELDSDMRRSQEVSLAAKDSHLKSLESLQRDHVQYLVGQGEISKSDELDRLRTIAKAAEDAEHAQLLSERAKLDAGRSSNPDYFTNVADINKRQQVLDDARALRLQKEEEDRSKGGPAKQGVSKELADQLAIQDEAGAASGLAVQMAKLKVENELLTASFQGIGGVLSVVISDLNKDFDSVGKDLVNAANDHKHFARDITREAKAMLKTLEGDIASQLLKLGLGKVVSHIPGLGPHKSPQQTATEDNTKATVDNTKWTQDQTLKIQEQMHLEELNSLAVTANTQAIRDLISQMQHCGCGEGKGGGGLGADLAAAAGGILGGLLAGLKHGRGNPSGWLPSSGPSGGYGGIGSGAGGYGGSYPGGSGGGDGTGIGDGGGGDGIGDGGINDGGGGDASDAMARFHTRILSPRYNPRSIHGSRGSSTPVVHQHITLHGHFSSSEIDEIGNKLVKHGRRIGAPA